MNISKVSAGNVNVTRITTGYIMREPGKKEKIVNFINEVKKAEEARKYHLVTKINLELNTCRDSIELSKVTKLEVTKKSNLKVTIQALKNNDGEGGDVEYVTLSFPIKLIAMAFAKVI